MKYIISEIYLLPSPVTLSYGPVNDQFNFCTRFAQTEKNCPNEIVDIDHLLQCS
jgi:hypothetical protein